MTPEAKLSWLLTAAALVLFLLIAGLLAAQVYMVVPKEAWSGKIAPRAVSGAGGGVPVGGTEMSLVSSWPSPTSSARSATTTP